MAVLEIIASATDNASKVLEGIGKTGINTAKGIEANWLKIGAATATAGVALEALARKSQATNLAIRNLSTVTGMTERETRKLTASLVNATFPLDDVNRLLEVGAQRGLDNSEALAEFANFWDMVGDATGEASGRLAESSVALNALGIDVDNQSEALNAFGFITTKTASSVGDFMAFIERTGPELRELGLNIDDTAAVLGMMEKELGMSGRVARTEFRQAVAAANGDMGVMLETLGLTNEQFQEYREQVGASAGVMEELADNADKNTTALQRLQALGQSVSVSFGGVIQRMADLAPLLLASAPIIKGVAVAKGLWAAAQIKLNAALLANPVGLLVAAIAALVAAVATLVYVVYRNWDAIIGKTRELYERLKGYFNNIVSFYIFAFGRIYEDWQGLWSDMVTVVSSVRDAIIDRIRPIIEWAQNAIDRVRQLAFWRRGSSESEESSEGGADVPVMHTGGTFRSRVSGGEGYALLRDGETVLPRGVSRRSQQINHLGRGSATTKSLSIGSRGSQIFNMADMFRGAHIRMIGPGDVERLNEQMVGMLRTRVRATG